MGNGNLNHLGSRCLGYWSWRQPVWRWWLFFLLPTKPLQNSPSFPNQACSAHLRLDLYSTTSPVLKRAKNVTRFSTMRGAAPNQPDVQLDLEIARENLGRARARE